MSRRTVVTDKQDFFLPGRVQVYALTLRHTQLLFAACVQSHSCREEKSCPKFNSTLKGTTPSQISGPKPGGRHPGELLISQRKHLPQRLLLAEVIKRISGNACSFESPGKQLLEGCNRLTNRTLALDLFEAWKNYSNGSSQTSGHHQGCTNTWAAGETLNLRSSTRTESIPLRSLWDSKRKVNSITSMTEQENSGGWAELKWWQMRFPSYGTHRGNRGTF